MILAALYLTVLVSFTLGAWWADANNKEWLRDGCAIVAFAMALLVVLVVL